MLCVLLLFLMVWIEVFSICRVIVMLFGQVVMQLFEVLIMFICWENFLSVLQLDLGRCLLQGRLGLQKYGQCVCCSRLLLVVVLLCNCLEVFVMIVWVSIVQLWCMCLCEVSVVLVISVLMCRLFLLVGLILFRLMFCILIRCVGVLIFSFIRLSRLVFLVRNFVFLVLVMVLVVLVGDLVCL